MHLRTNSRSLLVLLLLLVLHSRNQHGGCSARRHRPPPASSPLPIKRLLDLATAPSTSTSTTTLSSTARRSTNSDRSTQGQPNHLTDADFVYATGSCRDRMHLAKSSRAWRRGVRAFILTDNNSTEALQRLNAEGAAYNESYGFFPDDGDPLLDGVRHGTKTGDTRAALAPFAAHRHFGETYKWLLYGDDDTLFFMEPVKRMLSVYDPNLPYAFSDNLWHSSSQPNPHAPRCLPCHMANESLPSIQEIQNTPAMRDLLRKYLALRLATSTRDVPADALQAEVDNPREVPGRRFRPRAVCPYCTPEGACPETPDPNRPCQPSVAHGGAGMIFSVGLLRSLPYAEALACLRSFRGATGGDAMVSNCLWRHGIAFTDPGPLVRHLYDPHYHTFGAKAGLGFLMDPIGSMSHGRCNTTCRWMLRNTLSLHLKGRHFRSWRAGAILLWGVSRASEAAQSFLDLVGGDQSWKDLPYGADLEDASRFASYEHSMDAERKT